MYVRMMFKMSKIFSTLTDPRFPRQTQAYSTYSTERLLGAHQELTRMKSDYAKRTLCELERRAKGSSVGLLNRLELIQFANHYADCRTHDKEKLLQEYNSLVERIDADIEHDPSNLGNIEGSDLLKIAALSMLIDPTSQL